MDAVDEKENGNVLSTCGISALTELAADQRTTAARTMAMAHCREHLQPARYQAMVSDGRAFEVL